MVALGQDSALDYIGRQGAAAAYRQKHVACNVDAMAKYCGEMLSVLVDIKVYNLVTRRQSRLCGAGGTYYRLRESRTILELVRISTGLCRGHYPRYAYRLDLGGFGGCTLRAGQGMRSPAVFMVSYGMETS
jgi:hypothetical protein